MSIFERTYNTISFETKLVKVFKLSLALVKLVEVGLGQSDARMCLVNFHTEVVLDPLNCQILPQRTELIIDVQIVSGLVFPFAFKKLQSLLQHWLWTNLARIRSGCQSEIVLLNHSASTLDRHVFCSFIQVQPVCFLVNLRRVRLTLHKSRLHLGFECLLEFELF